LKRFDDTVKKLTNKERREKEFKETFPDFKPFGLGYAHFFENIVVYDKPVGLGKRVKSQLGNYISSVYGLVPKDVSCILYVRLSHTKSWIKRKGNQKKIDGWVYTGKPRIFKNGVLET
jgi:hypothetical protein